MQDFVYKGVGWGKADPADALKLGCSEDHVRGSWAGFQGSLQHL